MYIDHNLTETKFLPLVFLKCKMNLIMCMKILLYKCIYPIDRYKKYTSYKNTDIKLNPFYILPKGMYTKPSVVAQGCD